MGRAELVRDLTFRYPVQVIAEVLGVPRDDHELFHDCAVAIINVAADPDNGIKASQAMLEYLTEHVEARRREPGTDVISDLVTSEMDGEMLSDDEIFSFLRLLLPAGAETTYRASGNFLFGLLTHPEQLDAAARRPVAHGRSRRGGHPVGVAAAHHEPAEHARLGGRGRARSRPTPTSSPTSARPTTTRPAGTTPRSSTSAVCRSRRSPSGSGPTCASACTSRASSSRSLVNRLLDRLPNLRLDPDGDDPHIHGERFRSPTSLPVLFG